MDIFENEGVASKGVFTVQVANKSQGSNTAGRGYQWLAYSTNCWAVSVSHCISAQRALFNKYLTPYIS